MDKNPSYVPSDTEASDTDTSNTDTSDTEAQHTEAQHTEAQHTEAQHTEAQHTEAPHTEAPHTEAPHTDESAAAGDAAIDEAKDSVAEDDEAIDEAKDSVAASIRQGIQDAQRTRKTLKALHAFPKNLHTKYMLVEHLFNNPPVDKVLEASYRMGLYVGGMNKIQMQDLLENKKPKKKCIAQLMGMSATGIARHFDAKNANASCLVCGLMRGLSLADPLADPQQTSGHKRPRS